MIHHPAVLCGNMILAIVILITLIVLYCVLPPEQFHVALWIAAGVFVVGAAGLVVFAVKVLGNPDSKLGRQLALPRRTDADDDSAVGDRFSSMVGSRGVAASPLRPAGTAIFEHKRISVVTDGEFVEKGSPIEVVSAQGSRVVVRAAEPLHPAAEQ